MNYFDLPNTTGKCGIEDRLIPTDRRYRRALVLRNGNPLAIPEGFTLISPAKLWPVLKSPIFSPWGKLRMGLEYFVPRCRDGDDESLAAFVRRRFGREALERLVQPLVGGITTSDPEKLSLRAALPQFFDMEQQYRSLFRASKKQAQRQSSAGQKSSGARYGLFSTLAAGLSDLIDELEQRISAFGSIRLNTPVSAIRAIPDSQGWEVTFKNGSIEEFDAVILAVRAFRAADLVMGLDRSLAELLGGIEYASSAVVVTGHKLSDVRHRLLAIRRRGDVVPLLVEYKSQRSKDERLVVHN